MTVLIIHQHFRHPTEGGPIRSWYLGQALIKVGHKVIVVSRKNIDITEIKTIDGLEVHYLPVRYFNKMSFKRRVFSYLGFVIKGIRYCRTSSIIKNIDLCYCISTPLTSGIIGYWLFKKRNIPYFFEVGDLWPDAPKQMGAMNYPFALPIAKLLEKIIYQNACAVIGLSPDIVSEIKARTETQVFFVPNFSDIDFFNINNKKTEPQPKFTISYTGALGRANGLEYILMAAKEAEKQSLNIHFNIMGRGAVYNKLQAQVVHSKINNLSFIPFGNKTEVKKVLSKSQAIYVSYKKIPILETGSPNKFFDGLAAGKLIILNFNGWLANLIEEYNCGFTYDPENPEEFIQNLKIYLKNENFLLQAQTNALRLANDKFDLKVWEKEFTAIIEKQVNDC